MTELWDAKRCADFLGYSYDHFRKVIRYELDAPQPLDRPGRERWLSEDWIAWARGKSRNKSRTDHATDLQATDS